MAIRPNRKPMKFASGAKDRQQRNAIDDAIISAMSDDSERALSFDDTQLMKEMIGRKESLAESMMGGASGKIISDADRSRADRLIGRIISSGIRPEPRPDVGAIQRGNKAARRTAQDLASMEEGGEAGGVPKKYKGFSKLPEKVQEKISPDLADKYEYGGEVKGKKRKKSKGNVCRGGGAALRGTSFSGTK